MQLLLSNISFLILIPICFCRSNITTKSSCGTCSPCWNIFGKNYGPCSETHYNINPFIDAQPICMDTLILLILFLIGIITILPSCIWLLYLWFKRCRDNINDDTRYIMDGLVFI